MPQVRNDHVVDAGNGSGRFRPNRTCFADLAAAFDRIDHAHLLAQLY